MDEEFGIHLNEMPEAEREKVRGLTADYTLPLLVNWDFIGTGTLVQIGRHFGILTAEHVVNPPCKPKMRLVKPEVGMKLRTSVADFPHDFFIEVEYLQVFRTERRSDEYGPDLAFIKLPIGDKLNGIKARRSFLNLTHNSDEKLKSATDQNSFMAFTGFPAEEKSTREPELGFANVDFIKGYTFFSGEEHYERREGFDYIQVGVSREENNDAPVSFGGVSGGGLWRLPIRRKAGDPSGKEYFDGCHLAGVVFLQSDVENKHQFIRAHGPESIYSKFVPELLQVLDGSA